MEEPHSRDSPAGSVAVQQPGISDAAEKQTNSEEAPTRGNQVPVGNAEVHDNEPSSSSGEGKTLQGQHGEEDEKLPSELREQEIVAPCQIQPVVGGNEISPASRHESEEEWSDEKIDLPAERTEMEDESIALHFKKGRWGKYEPVPEQKLRNNLSGAVGYLEFANALDFAANVWNTIPVPTFAAALMGVGGAVAIILSFFAMRDGIKAWRNVKLLRTERAQLRAVVRDEEKAGRVIDGHDLDVKIEVNRRELGQEMVDRCAMDAFMGFSSLIVGIGTLLAIGGANPRVYHASNLLSGYIGNSPSAFWGLGNTLWSAFLFRRARRHYLIGTRDLNHEAVKRRLKKRTNAVRLHSLVMGLATLVSAPAGLVTATMWQGYPPLIPCIILAKWGNVIWKRRLGYTRTPISAASPSVNPESLIRELEWTICLQETLWKDKKEKRKPDVNVLRGKDSITNFMSKCGLLECFCLDLIQSGHIKHGEKDDFKVDSKTLEALERSFPPYAQVASGVLKRKGLLALAYRERYHLELLGASMYDGAMRARHSIARRNSTRG